MKTKSEVKRLALLKAAFAVVTEKGYFETTVDEVARRAGVAKGTVYLYFKDKPAIYIGLVDWLLEQALETIAAVAARPVSPRRRLEELFSTWATGMMSNPGVMALLSMENVNQSSTVMKRFRKHVLPRMLEMEDAVAGVLKQGIEQGEFRPVEPRVAATMFIGTFHAMLLSLARSPGARPDESIKELFFCGILAESRGRRTDGNRR
ncbi:TetR/AcrR family transcriptional regulator [candidate division WOR-3 bacterium]|uniref:TetR/AcrR family transcriptional regulator n=1 Tax=candidate division WOR-3 bacterium TaxID=2052148 RepID=A0A938BSR5_UNCW3|nr:TetR/AcrR family transcriptional regulator [candidate division WOR-3 bacterium]